MDAVNAFNHELFSLMDSKPPISRAKMISITKSAIKAMKLYKHVVQIVEKFIKKCKPEYKVAGLYVVDSIVRQSRHQFGSDKDVFGPRFTKNITGSFENLCLCPMEDRSKIVRVLNLWQKNGVFKIEVIQPLLDMAAASSSASAPYEPTDEPLEPGSPTSPDKEPVAEVMANSTVQAVTQLDTSDAAFAAVAQLFQSSQGQQLQQMLQNFQDQPVKPQLQTHPQPPAHHLQPPAHHLQAPAHHLQPPAQSVTPSLGMGAPHLPLSTQHTQQQPAFDKVTKLLDRFDYDDEPEGGEETKKDDPVPSQPPFMQQPQPPVFSQHMEHFKPHMIGQPQDPAQQGSLPPNGQLQGYGLPPGQGYPGMMPPLGQAQPGQPLPGSAMTPGFPGGYPPHNATQQQQDMSMDMDRSSTRDGRHGHRSHSGSRSPKRRRSRSNSRTRRSRHRRSRSRSRERRHHSPRSRSQERREREKEKDRRQRGLPQPKNDTLSVCSTTLWVGQLDKRTQQQDVACVLEEFGEIDAINMIPPRGCAYIVMTQRQDAFRALQKLSRGYKVNQKAIKIAWALNKGIKADFKQFWDVELGVTYIPWSKLKEEQLEELREGGMLDMDTLSPDWKGVKPEELAQNGRSESQQRDESQGGPVGAPPAQPSQGPPLQQQPMVGVGSHQLPVFPGPMGLPPPSFPPGVPPFMRPGFNPMQMPPGFPGAMPMGPPPPSKGGVEDPSMDPAGLANRKNDDGPEGPKLFNNQMGPMGNQGGGPPGGPSGTMQPPSGGLLGARPGIIPLQRPPVLPPPHMQRFPPPHGPRPPHPPNMPPMHPQMMHRGPHPQMMHHDGPPPPGGFGMPPPPHGIRGPFPGPHGPPPPFMRPGGPRGPDGPEEMDGRSFRGDRPGFRDRDREPERDWDRERDRERDRGFGGGRRPFGDPAGRGGGGGDRGMDGRERLGGWQEDGGGWERDRERDKDRDRERDRDRDRRDWREKRNSMEGDRERGRGEDEEREREKERGGGGGGRGEGGSRGRSSVVEGKDTEKPRRSERRERSTRWDRDDRLAELENIDKLRNSDGAEQPPQEVPATPSQTNKGLGKEPSPQKVELPSPQKVELPSPQKVELEHSATPAAVTESVTSNPSAPPQTDLTETKQEAES